MHSSRLSIGAPGHVQEGIHGFEGLLPGSWYHLPPFSPDANAVSRKPQRRNNRSQCVHHSRIMLEQLGARKYLIVYRASSSTVHAFGYRFLSCSRAHRPRSAGLQPHQPQRKSRILHLLIFFNNDIFLDSILHRLNLGHNVLVDRSPQSLLDESSLLLKA